MFSRNDLKELTYVHYFMKEANRLFPPVPVVTRQLASQRCIDGHVIPAGTTVVAHIYIVQHNPHVWDDPEVVKRCMNFQDFNNVWGEEGEACIVMSAV